MNIWKISLHNIKSKPLYTVLSVCALALSISLLLGMKQLKNSFEHQLENNLGDIDLVIGAKGSPLQLTLASVLHLDNPTGNIPYNEAKKIGKNPLIQSAVPISYGDNYKGYRIVGTNTEAFKKLYGADLEKGHNVQKTFEVVLGHTVAVQCQLSIGDTFLSSHGLVEATDAEVHDDKFVVVGILKPTQKVIDRLIVTHLESIWDVHDHDHDEDHHEAEANHGKAHDEHNDEEHHDEEHHETDHDEAHDEHHDEEHHGADHDDEHDEHHDGEETKQITSLLVSFRNPTAYLTLPRTINERTNMQAVLPKYELDKLYNYMGIGIKTITWIAYIILIISGLTIFISLYKMVKERSFELALLRTYGATPSQLILMVAYEGIIIGLLAFISALLFVKTLLPSLFKFSKTNFNESLLQELPLPDVFQIGGIVFIIILLSIIIAVYPIMKMKISKILSNEK